MQAALCGQEQLLLKPGQQRTQRACRRSVLVQAAVPPSAWPGRVPVPDTLPTRDGPKVSWPAVHASGVWCAASLSLPSFHLSHRL